MTIPKIIYICTFPSDDEYYYCHNFVVSTRWLVNWVKHFNQKYKNRLIEKVTIKRLLNEYTWDESWLIYQDAKYENAIAEEYDVK